MARLESPDLEVHYQATVDEVLSHAYETSPEAIVDCEWTGRFREAARRLPDQLGERKILELDWRALQRGLNPTNYDDRVTQGPIPG